MPPGGCQNWLCRQFVAHWPHVSLQQSRDKYDGGEWEEMETLLHSIISFVLIFFDIVNQQLIKIFSYINHKVSKR